MHLWFALLMITLLSFVTAAAAFAGTGAGDTIVAGVTMGVTAFTDPFFGMLAGIALKLLFGAGLGL